MLKSQVVTNVWKCDGLNCPVPEAAQEANPFFVVRVHKASVDSTAPIEIALCNTCVDTLTAPLIVAYVVPLKLN